MTDRTKINNRVFFTAFIAIIFLNLFLFKGMFHSLAFAGILATGFYPIFKGIQNKLKWKKEVASILTCLLIFLIIVLPVIYIIVQVSRESATLFISIRTAIFNGEVQEFLFGDGAFAKIVKQLIDLLALDISPDKMTAKALEQMQNYWGQGLQYINLWISDTFSFLFSFVIMVMAIYGFFIEGEALKDFIFKLSPLPDEQEQVVFDKLSQMNFVSLVCNGIGGLIQGGLAGLAFWIVGIESVVLWTTTMTILAFIPLVGISVISLPASIYLILTGDTVAGIFLLIFTSTVALLVENWFKPRFIGNRIQINSLVLLFYIIAGMSVFGMAGIFYGPVICTVFLAMVDLFFTFYLPEESKKGSLK